MSEGIKAHVLKERTASTENQSENPVIRDEI